MSKKNQPGLVNNLQQLQAGFGWSQARMAQEIGVSTSLLSQIYSGKKRLGNKLVGGVVARFPELKSEVLAVLEAQQ